MSEPIIRTENLTKIYGSGEMAVHALDGLTVEVQSGEFVAVMGPSGCGKSTLLNMLGALDQPTTGQVWVAGEDLSMLKNVDRFRAQTVGFVFQLHNLLPTLTAQENVEVPMQGQKYSPPAAQRAGIPSVGASRVGRSGRPSAQSTVRRPEAESGDCPCIGQ